MLLCCLCGLCGLIWQVDWSVVCPLVCDSLTDSPAISVTLSPPVTADPARARPRCRHGEHAPGGGEQPAGPRQLRSSRLPHCHLLQFQHLQLGAALISFGAERQSGLGARPAVEHRLPLLLLVPAHQQLDGAQCDGVWWADIDIWSIE